MAWLRCLIFGHEWMPGKYTIRRKSRCDNCGKHTRYRYVDSLF